jgi:hypothetical protein
MWAFTLLAESPQGDPLRQPEIIWGTVALMGALLLGAAVLHIVDRWRKKSETGSPDSTSALTDYRGMFERGEITEDEYIRLRDKVARQVKAPAKPPVAPQTPDANQLPPLPDPRNPPNPPSPA